jgi:hypothetical protein
MRAAISIAFWVREEKWSNKIKGDLKPETPGWWNEHAALEVPELKEIEWNSECVKSDLASGATT